MHLCALLLLLFAPHATAERSSISLSLQVEPQQEQCFFAEAVAGQRIEATVLVYRGGKLDVYLRVDPPNGGVPLFNKLLFSNLGDDGRMLPTIVKKGTTFAAPTTGVFSFCVDNRLAKFTAKVLTFDLTVSDAPIGPAGAPSDVVRAPAPGAAVPAGVLTSPEGAAAASALQHLARVKQIAWRLGSLEDRLLDDLKYHVVRARRHYDTLLSTEARVGWWAAAEMLAVALAACVQVMQVFAWFRNTGGGPAPASPGKGAPAPLFSLPGATPRKGDGSTSARGRV